MQTGFRLTLKLHREREMRNPEGEIQRERDREKVNLNTHDFPIFFPNSSRVTIHFAAYYVAEPFQSSKEFQRQREISEQGPEAPVEQGNSLVTTFPLT